MTMYGIVNGDSDIILDELIKQDTHYDLVLTDPPYNINKDFGNDSDKLSLDEFIQKTNERVKKIKRILTPTGSVIWFGIHNYICYVQIAMYNAGLYYRRMNIWHYENGFYRSTKKGEKKIWTPNPNGSMRSDIWDFPTLAGKRFEKERTNHPAQKPEALITEIIKAFCPMHENRYEGKILDPFFGSGTLGVCCEKLNLEGHKILWTGIEVEKQWCDLAERRLAAIKEKSNV